MLKWLKQQANRLKTEMQVLKLAYRDKRTPWMAKLLLAVAIGYLYSPIDLIPDFIPVLGQLDDLILVPGLIWLSLRLIPTIVLTEARQKMAEKHF